MNRLEAIRLIVETTRGEDLIIHSNGAISRESFHLRDRAGNFYLLGSMGLPAAVGLGLAVSRPDRTVIVLEGDGNALMGFGNLPMAGYLRPARFIHVVLDNGVYGTTGDQPTVSPAVDLAGVARACGYVTAQTVETHAELADLFPSLLEGRGPHFVRVRVSPEVACPCSRIPYSAEEIKVRFVRSLDE